MNNNSDNSIDKESSSVYYDACSNSKELYNKDIPEKSFSMKDNSKYNYESPPKKSLNNNNNNYNHTTNSTEIYDSNRPSNLNNNVLLQNSESVNMETEKKVYYKNSKKNINIHNMNSVKKRILTPIDENLNNIESSKEDLSNKNEINKNININIIINKKNKKKIENKYVYNNTNINNINNINNKNNIKIKNNDIKYNNKNINTINNTNSEKSIYSSLSEISYSTGFKRYGKIKEIENDDEDEEEEEKSNSTNNNNNKKSSFFNSNSNIKKKSEYEKSLLESIIKKQEYYKKMQLEKENTIVFQQNESLIINTINFGDISQDYLTVNELKKKYNLRDIDVRRKDITNKNGYLKTLIELQIFNFGECPIRCMKINKNGKYLAAGNGNGKIRIYEIMGYDYEKYEKEYNSKNIMNFLHFIEEKPIKELFGHKSDITDLSWSPFQYDLLLSASFDHSVIVWDISNENNNLVEKYEHGDIVTSVQFSPTNKNYFVTGCLDKYVRIYNISNYINQRNKDNTLDNIMDNHIDNNNIHSDIDNNNIENKNKKKRKGKLKESVSNFSLKDIKDFFNITDKITCVSYFPDGNQIAIGSYNGKINIYDLFNNNVRYNHSFTCRNRVGKNSLGKKVTSIIFINKYKAIITTCDSSIRLFSMIEGKCLSKYRGHTNEKDFIRSSVDLSSDIIISGSENCLCYVWHISNEEKKKKIYDYECFKPFTKDIVECSIIIDEKCYVNYIKKILKLTNKINVVSVIINSTSKGKIDVLLNIDEDIK